MKAGATTLERWAVRWSTTDKSIDGETSHLHGGLQRLFLTRQDARDHIKQEWGYLKARPDLRAYPHGWKMPVAVRVTVKIEEAA